MNLTTLGIDLAKASFGLVAGKSSLPNNLVHDQENLLKQQFNFFVDTILY